MQHNSPIVGNRIPPNSSESEIAVLGAMMLSKKAIEKAEQILTTDSFYHEKHRLIFEAILQMKKKGIAVDLVTLSNYLSEVNNLKKVGGRATIAKINKEVATYSNVEQYSLIVSEKEFRRELIGFGGDIINSAYDESNDILSEVSKVESGIFKISEKRISKNYLDVRRAATQTYHYLKKVKERAEAGVTGISSGLIDLDKYTGGFQDSDLVIIAARPSMGKTALSLSLAWKMAHRGVKVAFFSLEMASNQLILRLISQIAQVNLQKIRTAKTTNDEDQKIIDALGLLTDTTMFFDDSAMLEITELQSKCRKLKAEHDIDIIFVDYLQLVRSSGADTREREIAEVSMRLKATAKELDIPVIALAQLNRAVESRPGKSRSPMLSDLRESGSIEQDADVIMFVQRREVYGQTEYEDKTSTQNTAELIIGKQRNGPIGTVRTAFKKNFAEFDNLGYGYEEMPNQGKF